MEYPYQKNTESPLYEAFPMVMLTMASGEVIRLNYFMKYWKMFIPTRYMEVVSTDFMPTVSYHSSFITPNDVMQKFVLMVETEMKKSGMRMLQVSPNTYVKWDAVTKIEIEMQHYVVAFDKVTWNDKHPIIEEEPRLVTDLSELEEKAEVKEEKKEEIDFEFLDKGADMFKDCL